MTALTSKDDFKQRNKKTYCYFPTQVPVMDQYYEEHKIQTAEPHIQDHPKSV